MKILILTGYSGFTFRTHNILCLLKKKIPIQVSCYVYGKENFNWLNKNNKDGLYTKIYCIDEILENIEKNLFTGDQLNENVSKIVKNSAFNITKSLYAERFLVQHTHESYYSKQFNQDQINQYFFQIYNHLRKSLDKIDFVYTYHSSSIFSYLISELCKEKKIKFKTLVHDRISKTFFFSNTNEQLLPAEKIQKYIQNIEITKESKKIIDDFVNNLKNRKRSSYIISGQIQNLKRLKINFKNIKSFFFNFFSKKDIYLQKTNFQRIKEKFNLKLNQTLSLRYFNNKLDLKHKILYLPLQFAPETTTLVSAVDQYDQLSMIKKMSIYIPPDWKLVVKEHPSMIGKRSYNFYKELNRIYNVFIINPLYNSLELINKSAAVITVSGTTGLEAYALGKPTLVLGKIHYDVLKGINKISNYNEIYGILRNIVSKDNNQENNQNELYKFMSAIRIDDYVENNNDEFWTKKTFEKNYLDTDVQIAKNFEKYLSSIE